MDLHKRDEEAVRRNGRHDRNRREQVGKGRQQEDDWREEAVGNDSCCDESSNHHGEVVSDDGIRHDGGYNHELGEAHDHSIHQQEGSRLDGKVGEIEIGNDHCAESRLESMGNER